MKSLMNLNGGVHRHFLSGEEEIRAFQNNEFIRMHNSTLAKVTFFYKAIKDLVRGKLNTASKGWGVALDRLFEGRTAKTVGLIGTVITIAVGLWQTGLWIGIIK